MCEECDAAGKVLPSIESFQEQWKLPKVHFLFYDYCFKPVIKESVWYERINAPQTSAGDRLGPMIAEAYAFNSLVVNHYCPWVYQYKIDNPNNTLVTVYDQHDDVEGGDNGDQQETEIDLFCGDLDLAKCEISLGASVCRQHRK
jgi:hypothetical protein